jgi:Tfp pilus assembly protein PilN
MQSSSLDFAAQRPLFSPLGAALMLLGIAFAASVAVDAVDALAQREKALEKRAQLTARAAELRGVKVQQARVAAKDAGRGNAPDEREARRIAEAQKVIRAIAAPWDEIFDALEKAQDDSVALLSIAPERAAGRLAMSGEAKSYEALTAWLARLDASGSLQHAQLLAHEIKGSDRHVVFTASASLRK